MPLKEQHLIKLLTSISLENLIWFTPVWVNCVRVKLPQWCLTLCDPTDCSPPGSSVHGILQGRILEWVAMPSPGDIPDPGIEPRSPALQADSLPAEPL